AGLRFFVDLAEMLERGQEPRHADGEPGRRHRLADETGDEPVIAPATRHRSEAHGIALLVLHFEGELGLVNGAGVIFEAADDGGVDADTISAVASRLDKSCDFLKLLDASFRYWV